MPAGENNTVHLIKDFGLALLSALLLVLAFPPYSLHLLAWVGLVPLLVAIGKRGLFYSFFISLVCGCAFFAGIFNWILAVQGYKYLHHVLLGIYLGLFFGVFGVTFTFITRSLGRTAAYYLTPFLWVTLEYIRSNFFFLALPWALMAHTQYENPTLIQIAALSGTYGVSFIIVLINVAIAAYIDARWNRAANEGNLRISAIPYRRKTERLLPLVAGLCLLGALVYGNIVIRDLPEGDEITLSAIQGNIAQEKKWEEGYADEIMETYLNLTNQVITERPDLVIWPETATPKSFLIDPKVRGSIIRLTRDTGTNLLFGSSRFQKFERDGKPGEISFNSAFMVPSILGKGAIQRYDKIKLFPFSEYLPLKGKVPWSLISVSSLKNHTPGEKHTVFDLAGSRFGVTICWENIFSEIVRKHVLNGAQFIVNITNEARFDGRAAPYQFVSMSVFRAVENRIFVFRCANTGISCLINPFGKIVDRVSDDKGSYSFIRGTLTARVVPSRFRTIYTRYGNLPVYFSATVCIIFVLFALAKAFSGGYSRKSTFLEYPEIT